MNKPTDAEIAALYTEQTGFILDDSPAALLDFARAVLAKWGQPAHSGEPVECDCRSPYSPDECTQMTGCKIKTKLSRKAPKPGAGCAALMQAASDWICEHVPTGTRGATAWATKLQDAACALRASHGQAPGAARPVRIPKPGVTPGQTRAAMPNAEVSGA